MENKSQIFGKNLGSNAHTETDKAQTGCRRPKASYVNTSSEFLTNDCNCFSKNNIFLVSLLFIKEPL